MLGTIRTSSARRSRTSLLFLIHAAVIADAVFVVVQAVSFGTGALIVGFCTK